MDSCVYGAEGRLRTNRVFVDWIGKRKYWVEERATARTPGNTTYTGTFVLGYDNTSTGARKVEHVVQVEFYEYDHASPFEVTLVNTSGAVYDPNAWFTPVFVGCKLESTFNPSTYKNGVLWLCTRKAVEEFQRACNLRGRKTEEVFA